MTTRGGCFAEAGGPGSAYVDPRDPEELARGARRAARRPRAPRRDDAAAAAPHAARFSDAAIADDLFRVYEEALAS